MNVVYASNEQKGILITCPHCKLGSRYDGSYIEDAVKIRHDIVCVACGEVFNLVVSIPTSEAVEQSVHRTCAKCGASRWANVIIVGNKEYCTACGASR